MVSQPVMRRFFGSSSSWLGLLACLVFVVGCGQGEGERCQVDSDCRGGFVCRDGTTGNGRCRASDYTGPDAAVKTDAAKDLLSPLSPETELETGSEPGRDSSVGESAVYDASVDTAADGPIGGVDSTLVDVGTDLPRFETPRRDAGIEAPAGPEAGVDAVPLDTATVDAERIDA
jgi:hypothetical protein